MHSKAPRPGTRTHLRTFEVLPLSLKDSSISHHNHSLFAHLTHDLLRDIQQRQDVNSMTSFMTSVDSTVRQWFSEVGTTVRVVADEYRRC